MYWPISDEPYGVDASSGILTSRGWVRLRDVEPGAALVHPEGLSSTLLAVHGLGERDIIQVTLADKTSFRIDVNQPVHVMMGPGKLARPYILDGYYLQDALARDRLLRLPRHAPYEFGGGEDLPMDPWLLGALLGDGYLRNHGVEWCNQQQDMYDLVRASLPLGASLTPLRYGQAGTGSASIVGRDGRNNPVLLALRSLGLAGARAWEKHIPPPYLRASAADRLRLLGGLLETDGSIDGLGRIELGTSSERLANDIVELVHGLGGRAPLTRRTGVTFTSPRQKEPKSGRDCFRLTNIRLPEGICPFQRADRVARMQHDRQSRHWKIKRVEYVGSAPVVAVSVSAPDGIWIAEGAVPLHSSPLPSASAGAA